MADTPKTKTYYLKANREHAFIKDGVLNRLTEVNAEVELRPEAYEAFKDKFNEEPVSVPKPKAEETEEKKSEDKTPAPAADKK